VLTRHTLKERPIWVGFNYDVGDLYAQTYQGDGRTWWHTADTATGLVCGYIVEGYRDSISVEAQFITRVSLVLTTSSER
jgi:hypothetical protein